MQDIAEQIQVAVTRTVETPTRGDATPPSVVADAIVESPVGAGCAFRVDAAIREGMTSPTGSHGAVPHDLSRADHRPTAGRLGFLATSRCEVDPRPSKA